MGPQQHAGAISIPSQAAWQTQNDVVQQAGSSAQWQTMPGMWQLRQTAGPKATRAALGNMTPADNAYELWQLSAITPDRFWQHTQLIKDTQLIHS